MVTGQKDLKKGGTVVEKAPLSLKILLNVRLVEPKTIERSMGKAKRVIDKRDL